MKRAQTLQQKNDRKMKILSTAEDLFRVKSDEFPSVQEIANASGIAKGTVYLYFKTKEDIFLALIENYYNRWLMTFETSLQDGSPPEIKIVINNILNFLTENPLFFRLNSYSTIIEACNSQEHLLAFKQNLAILMKKTTELLSVKFQTTEEQSANWLLDTFAYLTGLWNMSYPPEKVALLLKENNLSIFLPEFKHRAAKTLLLFWKQGIEKYS